MIFPTTAKAGKVFHPSARLREAYPEGTLFATTPSGSACRETLDQLIENLVDTLGDVADEPGKRIVLKLDGGPALPKSDPEWLWKQRNRGIWIYPGLPNGSAVNQVRLIREHAM